MNTLSGLAFLMPLFVKSIELMILKISSCEAWKGWGRGEPAFGSRPLFLAGGTEDSPQIKKFPLPSAVSGGFQVP